MDACKAAIRDTSYNDSINYSLIPKNQWYTRVWNDGWGPEPVSFPLFRLPLSCESAIEKNLSNIRGCMETMDKAKQCKRHAYLKLLRERLVLIAKRYDGLLYQHHHIPTWNPLYLPLDVLQNQSSQLDVGPELQLAGPGLDCSNFVAWIYNYALGISFTPGIQTQAETVGRQLNVNEQWQPGDLIYFQSERLSIMDAVNDLAHNIEYHGPAQQNAEQYVFHVAMYLGTNTIIDTLPTYKNQGVTIHALTPWYRKHIAFVKRIVE